jgi:AcrR family transcriptional regulator
LRVIDMPTPLDNRASSQADTVSEASGQPDTVSAEPRAAGSRARLLDAIVQVTGGKGYAQTTVTDVIASAGASRSTFYGQFEDREQCLIAALAQLAEQTLDEVRLALLANPERDPARSAVAAIVAAAEQQSCPARVLWVESLGAGARALAIRDGLIDAIVELIEAAREQDHREVLDVPAREEGEQSGNTHPGNGREGGEGREVLDVPALGLIGGVARLFSMRLPRGEAAMHGLAGDLDAWAASYALQGGRPRWHHGCKLGETALRPAPEPAPARSYPPLPRGRHKLSQAEIARSQRERIMHALAREAYEHGYEAISVADVVRAAGVARNVFYEQFSDKQQAAVAALQQTFEHALVATASHFFAGEDWPERIWRMGGALTEHYYSNPVEAHLSFVELHAIGGGAVPLAHERLSAFTLLLEEGYRHRSPTEPLPRTVSEALVATVLELGYRQAPRAGVELYPVLLGQQTYMCLAPFVGAGVAGELVANWLDGARPA